jgi:hypothetical protein
MTEQEKREKVIKGLMVCFTRISCKGKGCPYESEYERSRLCQAHLRDDALALLQAQETATIEPKRIDLPDETKAWLDKMDAVDALSNIADICMDWDGYRTANGLGGLINEIWAYARYCADRLQKAQEPVEPTIGRCEEYDGHDSWWYQCGKCQKPIDYDDKYCRTCGQAVKWE